MFTLAELQFNNNNDNNNNYCNRRQNLNKKIYTQTYQFRQHHRIASDFPMYSLGRGVYSIAVDNASNYSWN